MWQFLILLVIVYLVYQNWFLYSLNNSTNNNTNNSTNNSTSNNYQNGAGLGSPRNYLIYANGNTIDPNNTLAVLANLDGPNPSLQYLQNEYNILRIRAEIMQLDSNDLDRLQSLQRMITNIQNDLIRANRTGILPQQKTTQMRGAWNDCQSGGSSGSGGATTASTSNNTPNISSSIGPVVNNQMASDVLTGTGSGPPINPPLGPLPGAPLANTISQLGTLKDSISNLLSTVYRIPTPNMDGGRSSMNNNPINRANPYYGVPSAAKVPSTNLLQTLSQGISNFNTSLNNPSLTMTQVVNTATHLASLSQLLESRLTADGNNNISMDQAQITNMLQSITASSSLSQTKALVTQILQAEQNVQTELSNTANVMATSSTTSPTPLVSKSKAGTTTPGTTTAPTTPTTPTMPTTPTTPTSPTMPTTPTSPTTPTTPTTMASTTPATAPTTPTMTTTTPTMATTTPTMATTIPTTPTMATSTPTTPTTSAPTAGNFVRQPRTIPMPPYATNLPDNQRWINAHNFFRSINCVPPVTWNTDAANQATAWANQQAALPPLPSESPNAPAIANIYHPVQTPAQTQQYLTLPNGSQLGQNIAWGGPDIIGTGSQPSYEKEIEDVVADWYEEVNLPNVPIPDEPSIDSDSNGNITFTPSIAQKQSEIQTYYNQNLTGCSPGITYKYSGPDNCNLETGHFTQVVWKDTTQIGCAKVPHQTIPGTYVWVCDYSPPGNIEGEYQQEVLNPTTCPNGYVAS